MQNIKYIYIKNIIFFINVNITKTQSNNRFDAKYIKILKL